MRQDFISILTTDSSGLVIPRLWIQIIFYLNFRHYKGVHKFFENLFDSWVKIIIYANEVPEHTNDLHKNDLVLCKNKEENIVIYNSTSFDCDHT